MNAFTIPGKPSDYYHTIINRDGETVYAPNRENLFMLAMAQHAVQTRLYETRQSNESFIDHLADVAERFMRNEPPEAIRVFFRALTEEINAVANPQYTFNDNARPQRKQPQAPKQSPQFKEPAKPGSDKLAMWIMCGTVLAFAAVILISALQG